MIKPLNLTQQIAGFLRGHAPGQLVIQLTDRCNARCPQCNMRITNRFRRSTLEREKVFRILDAAAERGINIVSFTGGEPLLIMDDLIEWIKYAGRLGIRYIRTGTNGYLFAEGSSARFEDRIKELAARLADTPIRNFWVSIDSVSVEEHERMRGFSSVIKGIEKALPIFHAHGVYPSVNLGLNRNLLGARTRSLTPVADRIDDNYLDELENVYQTGMERFYEFALDLGFTMASVCYPMSVDEGDRNEELNAVYGAASTDHIVRYRSQEKARIFRALGKAVEAYRSRLRLFTPLSSLLLLQQQYARGGQVPFQCLGGVDFFFVNAKDCGTYPCGYRGDENLGPFWQMDMPYWAPDSDCQKCDWECFRDPSALFGPFLGGFKGLFGLMGLDGARFLKLWWQDLRYYRACDLFDGRIPPDTRRLRAFDG